MSIFSTNIMARREASPRVLAQMPLSGNMRSIYDAPSGGTATVEWMVICNANSAAVNFYLHHVRADETAGIANAIVYGMRLAAQTSLIIENPIYLRPGESIHAKTDSTSNASVSLYGVDGR